MRRKKRGRSAPATRITDESERLVSDLAGRTAWSPTKTLSFLVSAGANALTKGDKLAQLRALMAAAVEHHDAELAAKRSSPGRPPSYARPSRHSHLQRSGGDVMRDWLDIGASPPGEPCAQLGSDGYFDRARKECKAYIALLRRVLGPEPDGAALCVRSNPHDFGTYLSVACSFETEDEASVNYAFRCESEGPDEWDDQARAELAAPATRKESQP